MRSSWTQTLPLAGAPGLPTSWKLLLLISVHGHCSLCPHTPMGSFSLPGRCCPVSLRHLDVNLQGLQCQYHMSQPLTHPPNSGQSIQPFLCDIQEHRLCRGWGEVTALDLLSDLLGLGFSSVDLDKSLQASHCK